MQSKITVFNLREKKHVENITVIETKVGYIQVDITVTETTFCYRLICLYMIKIG